MTLVFCIYYLILPTNDQLETLSSAGWKLFIPAIAPLTAGNVYTIYARAVSMRIYLKFSPKIVCSFFILIYLPPAAKYSLIASQIAAVILVVVAGVVEIPDGITTCTVLYPTYVPVRFGPV